MKMLFEVTANAASMVLAPKTRQIEWLTSHLPDPKDQRDYARQKAVAAISSTIERAMKSANLNRVAIAEKLGWEKSQVSRALRGTHNMTIFTLGDLLWACDLEVENFDRAVTRLGVVEVSIEDNEAWAQTAAVVYYPSRSPPIHVDQIQVLSISSQSGSAAYYVPSLTS
jgi:transcriptional regulator with XRE-family HTH domain